MHPRQTPVSARGFVKPRVAQPGDHQRGGAEIVLPAVFAGNSDGERAGRRRRRQPAWLSSKTAISPGATPNRQAAVR